jgi:hypothetical protein
MFEFIPINNKFRVLISQIAELCYLDCQSINYQHLSGTRALDLFLGPVLPFFNIIRQISKTVFDSVLSGPRPPEPTYLLKINLIAWIHS